MRSPVFPDVNLQPKEIEPGLSAYECPQSGGFWIPLQAYEQWKAQRPAMPAPAATNSSPESFTPVAQDPKRPALICPESGVVMLRYKAGQGLPFHLDRSPATGGVWLDKGEWEALKQRGLHLDLSLIFTASYQRDQRAAEYAQSLEKVFEKRIGPSDFQRVAEFKEWMAQHPKHSDILCYLSDTKA
jgi:Zn-finger nucleic acid-binding protein